MNKDAKRINPNHSAQISITKSNIRNSNGKMFHGDGYVFLKAIRELRKKEKLNIVYHRKTGSYQIL